MGRHAILYLSPAGLVCHRQGTDATRPDERFTLGGAGLQAFAAWLRQTPASTRLSLLIDLPDEGFQLESLPFVRGPDRRRMLERRCQQIFPGNPCIAHLSLGREVDGRRDERVLIAALTRPAAVTPWLDEIARAECRLGNLVSVPFLAMQLAAKLPAGNGPILLAQVTPAGLRVTCFDKGRLRFSRLSPADAPDGAPSASLLRAEVQRTYQYLAGQRILARSAPCTCYVLGPSDTPAKLPDGTPELQFIPLALPQLAQSVGLSPAPAGADSLPLLLHLLARRPRLPQFAPPATQRLQRRQKAALAIAAIGALGLSAGLLSAVLNLLHIREAHQQSAATLGRAQAAESELASLIAAIPPTPMPLDPLRATIGRITALHAGAGGPESALRQLAKALNGVPGVELQKIEWAAAGNASPAPNTAQPSTEDPQQTLIAHFTLPPSVEQARARVTQAEEILAALRRIPGADVRIEHMPAEMNAEQVLRATDLQPGGEAPRLVARIQLPPATP